MSIQVGRDSRFDACDNLITEDMNEQMNIQDKCNCTSDECFHGKVKYTTALGLDLTLTNHMGNTTLNVRKANDVSIEGVTQLEHGQVRMHVSR